MLVVCYLSIENAGGWANMVVVVVVVASWVGCESVEGAGFT